MQRPSIPVASNANLSGAPVAPASVPPANTQNGTFLAAASAIRPPLPPPPDPGIDLVLNHTQDIRNNISGLLVHIETQTDYLSWPSIMDRFSLISSQMASLAKTMKNEKIPDLRKVAVVPYLVTQEADSLVEKLTEGRISSVNHENVPTYLRTKLDPEVEHRFENALSKVPLGNQDAVQKADKQIQQLNKIVTTLIDHVDTAKSEWDSKAAGKSTMPPTYNQNDTNALLGAIFTGKGLQPAAGLTGARAQQQQQIATPTGPGAKSLGSV